MSLGSGLAQVLTFTYATLAFLCAMQLSRVIIHRHNKASFQCGFLSLGLVWTLVRVLYFVSFTERDKIVDLFLYWYPIAIQFATFSLIVVFHAYMLFKNEWAQKRRVVIFIYYSANAFVFVQTTVYILLCYRHGVVENGSLEKAQHLFVCIESLLLLATYAYVASRLLGSRPIHSSLSRDRTILPLSLLVVFIFASRCIYNLLSMFDAVAIVIGSDQGVVQIGIPAFMFLFVWEIVPMLVLLVYFRHIPGSSFWRRCLSPCLGVSDANEDRRLGANLLSFVSQSSSPGLLNDNNFPRSFRQGLLEETLSISYDSESESPRRGLSSIKFRNDLQRYDTESDDDGDDDNDAERQ